MAQENDHSQPPLEGATAVLFGGTGFIGRHLTRALQERGVRAIVQADVVPPPAALPDGVRFEHVDVREPIALDPPEQPLVFNLAAVHRTPGHPDREYYETNLAGAEHVTAFASEHGTTSLWFTSSIAVYGPSEEPKREDSELRPVSAYGKSKAQAEEIHRAWAAGEAGRRLVNVRPATVFGPGEGGNFTRLAGALRRRRFLYPGRKDTIKACGYVDELTRTMLHMWRFAEPEVTYNFTYDDPPTIEEICAAFHDVGGLPRPLGVAPVRPLLAVARGLKAAGLHTFDPERVVKLMRSTHILPAKLVEVGYEYETDLRSALARWRDEDPRGEFV
jgi:nucleoside-diphosphate-sugar epimerase